MNSQHQPFPLASLLVGYDRLRGGDRRPLLHRISMHELLNFNNTNKLIRRGNGHQQHRQVLVT